MPSTGVSRVVVAIAMHCIALQREAINGMEALPGPLPVPGILARMTTDRPAGAPADQRARAGDPVRLPWTTTTT